MSFGSSSLLSGRVQQYPVSGFQCHFHALHLLGDVLRHAPYHAFPQVGGDLRPGIRRDVDAAVHRASHVGGYLAQGIVFHRVRHRYALLPVGIIHFQFHVRASERIV